MMDTDSNQMASRDFELIVENHKGIIYKVANSYCKDDDDRKDLVQEIVIQLWRSFHRFNNSVKLSTWDLPSSVECIHILLPKRFKKEKLVY